jgi:hypothetical protein
VSIVGLWQVTFVAKGNPAASGIPDGAVIDMGYATWHSDGTEIMNSGRDPATSSFCMGVWERTGYFNYALNHVTISWVPAGTNCTPLAGNAGCFQGPGNIKEQITLDPSGQSFTGTFTIVQYDSTGKNTLATIVGTITAQRITAQ